MLAVAAFLTTVTTAHAASGPVRATLKLTPSETLPGVPVAVEIQLENTTASEVHAGGTVVVFEITNSAGWSFLASSAANVDVNSKSDDDDEIVIPPNGARTFYFGAGWLDSPMFSDRRLSIPGRYSLRAVFPGALANLGAALKTNSVDLHIEEPTDADAVVWKKMNEFTGDTGWAGSDWAEFGTRLAVFAATNACVSLLTTGYDLAHG